MRITCLFLAFIAVSVSRVTSSDNVNNYSILLEKAILSLNKLLDYMLQPRSVVGDMIFGVVLSAAQLSILKKHLKAKNTSNGIINATVVNALEQKFKEINKIYMPIRINPNRTEYNVIMDYVVKQDFWDEEYPIVEGRLKKSFEQRVSYEESKNQPSRKEIEDLVMMGTPQELESDACIAQLFQPKICDMSLKCNYIMTNNEEVHGYPLTHRLFYFQIAERLGCGKFTKFGDLQKQILDLCSDILGEMYYIIELGIPPSFRDLFLEQISLCGIEGFAEFLNPHFIEWAVRQQMPSGCFTQVKENILLGHHNRIKREDGELDDGCTMHITGMAALYLTLNIRAIVEYWNLLN